MYVCTKKNIFLCLHSSSQDTINNNSFGDKDRRKEKGRDKVTGELNCIQMSCFTLEHGTLQVPDVLRLLKLIMGPIIRAAFFNILYSLEWQLY